MSEVSNFYAKQGEPNQSCFLALRDIIKAFDERIAETVKYKMPCFCVGKKAMCYLWKDKKTNHPYILFVEGKSLNHPSLEQGDRARMKVLKVNPEKDLPVEEINTVLSQAFNLFQI